ncbi:MAG: response regulator [Chitinivibrionales bacterium]|nr:response regulator [Chitinivibrionales bacterium]
MMHQRGVTDGNEFSAMLDAVPAVVCRFLPDGSITFVNQLFCDTFDGGAHKFLGDNFFSLLPKRSRAKLYAYCATVTVQTKPVTFIHPLFYNKERDNQSHHNQKVHSRWMEWQIQAIFNAGRELVNFYCFGRDTTRECEMQKRCKQLQQYLVRAKKMESLGMLAGSVAHDLNNILSGIILYPELLLQNVTMSQSIRKDLEMIRTAGQRAAEVVDDLLNTTRCIVAKKQVINLNTAIREFLLSIEFNHLVQTYPHIHFSINLDPSLHVVKASINHIKKAVMNLVNNAFESIEKCGRVSITTYNIAYSEPRFGFERIEQGAYAVIVVSDTGIGISKNALDRIFQPFYTTKVMGRSGTGLGLTIVQNIVHDHNGFLDVSSGDHGTSFELILPAVHYKVRRECTMNHSLSQYRGGGQRVIIIDDEPGHRELLCRVLQSLDYVTEAVATMADAQELLKNKESHLILLDVLVPSLLESPDTVNAAAIHAMFPGKKVVFMSSSEQTTSVKTLAHEVSGLYLRKPFTTEQIARTLKRALRQPSETC